MVMRPNQSPTVEAGRRRFDVLVRRVEFPGFGRGMCKWTEIRLQRIDFRIVYPEDRGNGLPERAGRGGSLPFNAEPSELSGGLLGRRSGSL